MANRKGRVTIPTDLDVVPQTKEIMERWGADALRDCDGTEFPQELKVTPPGSWVVISKYEPCTWLYRS